MANPPISSSSCRRFRADTFTREGSYIANALYPKFKQALLNKEADLDTDIIKATLIDSADYTYGAGHASYATDIAVAAAKVAVSPQLTSPTIVDGVFDTADFTWSTVTGDQSEAIVLWDDSTTSPTADLLICFFDAGMTGMPVTPNGGNINVTVHASGWFAL